MMPVEELNNYLMMRKLCFFLFVIYKFMSFLKKMFILEYIFILCLVSVQIILWNITVQTET